MKGKKVIPVGRNVSENFGAYDLAWLITDQFQIAPRIVRYYKELTAKKLTAAQECDLFKEYFDNYTDVELPIFNSSGVLSTRISYIDAADAFGGTNLCRMHIPDARGRTLVGRDDMNNTAANRITAIGCGIDGTVLGATGGDQRTATHGHANTISASSGTESAQHTHNTGIEAYNSSDFTPSGRIQGCKSPGTYQYTDFFSSGVESATHTHPITIAGGVTNFSGGISANIQPAFICNIMIKL